MASLTYDQLMAVSDQGLERRLERLRQRLLLMNPDLLTKEGRIAGHGAPSTTHIAVARDLLTKAHGAPSDVLSAVARDLLSAHCRASDMMTDHPDVDGFLAAYE